MNMIDRLTGVRLAAVLAAGLLSVAAWAGDGDNAAASAGNELKPGPDSDLDVFALGFMHKVAGDDAFRDACAADLASCLEKAGRSVPGGAPMQYTYDAESGHTLVYKTSFGGTRTAHLRQGEPVEMTTEGGFQGRTTQSTYDQLAYMCWTVWECANGASHCSCARHANVYPCSEDPLFVMPCSW